MNLENIIKQLNLKVLTQTRDFTNVIPTAGYASDLLSCVMAGASHQSIWVTLQAHSNIVAVAALLELSAIIISENCMPDEATISKANEESIILLSSSYPTFYIIGKLWELGIRDK